MIVRALIWIIAGFLVYTVFQMIKQSFLKPPSPPAEKTSRGEDMVLDPECGTYVPKGDAIVSVAKGKTSYFCSTDCREKYEKNQ